MKPLRTGMLGCGGIAQKHAHAAMQLDDEIELVAFCDHTEANARAFAGQFTVGRGAVFTDHRVMFNQANLDLLIVCLPPFAHTTEIELAAERGIHLLVEKPIALSSEQAWRRVDGVRIGSDVGVEWLGHLSAQSLLRDQATRNFTNQILWQTDPDCILLRDRFHHLTDVEVRSLALYAAMSGGVTMTSDTIDELSVDRLRLWKFILNSNSAICHFPFLGQSPIEYERLPTDLNSHRVRHQAVADPVLVQVRASCPAERGEDRAGLVVFIFNTGDVPVQRTYALAALGIPDTRYVYDWTNQRSDVLPTPQISVTLAPHDGALLFASPTPITRSPEHLP